MRTLQTARSTASRSARRATSCRTCANATPTTSGPWTPGVDNREEVLRELERIFPRWYDRQFTDAHALDGTLVVGEPQAKRSFEDTVRDYPRQELTRDAILARAERLLSGEVQGVGP